MLQLFYFDNISTAMIIYKDVVIFYDVAFSL